MGMGQFKVTQGPHFRYQWNGKHVCDFLLMNNSNILFRTISEGISVGQIFGVDKGCFL